MKEDEDETKADRQQKDATNSNKRLTGGMGKLQLEDVLVKVCLVDW